MTEGTMTEELLKWLLSHEPDVEETIQSFALDLSLSAHDMQQLVRRLDEIGIMIGDADTPDEEGD